MTNPPSSSGNHLDALAMHVASELSPPAAAPAASSPPAATPVPTPASPVQYLTFNTALLLCLLTAVITLMLAFYAPVIAAKRGFNLPGASVGSKVVYLDFDVLMTAGVKRALAEPQAGAELQKQADKFQSDINAAVQAYADAGYVVINIKALIRGSKTQDITDDVLKTLGLK